MTALVGAPAMAGMASPAPSWFDSIAQWDPDPLLKWAGSKRAIRQSLAWNMPRDFAAYHEPFFGSGALFFFLRAKGWNGHAYVGDTNLDLMQFHAVVRDDASQLISEIKRWTDQHERNSDTYKLARDAWNGVRDRWSLVERAACLWYLNHACFNGLWRVNQSGEFNVPSGDRKRISAPSFERVAGISSALQAAHINTTGRGFMAAASDVQAGDFVYFDPPYLPTSETASFTAYEAKGFSPTDHRSLAMVARECLERGAKVMISNSDMPLIRDLYRGFRIFEIQAPRRIAANGDRRKNVGELLIIGGY